MNKIIIYIITFFVLSNLIYAGVVDSDKDGVPDEYDTCPLTDTTMVDNEGCSCAQKTCEFGYNCILERFNAVCRENVTLEPPVDIPVLLDKPIANCFDDASPGSGISSHLISLNDSVVYESAIKALQFYAENTLSNLSELNTSNKYIDSVVYYLNYNMGSNHSFIRKPASYIIKYSHNKSCGKEYCGDSTDRAILTTALLRSLSVSWRCAYVAESDNHVFNIVDYLEAYRIVDRGYLGYYFYTGTYTQNYAVNNIWNDYLGGYNADLVHPSEQTYNYPDGPVCPTGGWTDQTYYIDGCPFLNAEWNIPGGTANNNNNPPMQCIGACNN